MNTAPLTTMLDSAYAPNAAQIAAARKVYPNLTAWAGYLPSPGAFHAWSVEDFAVVKSAGLDVLPIYVTAQGRALNGRTEGASDGHGALSACEQYKLSGPVCVDVEEPVWAAGNAASVAHASAFAQVCRESSRESVGYGPTAYARATSAIHAAVWFGQYPYEAPAIPDPFSMGFAAPAGWQWKGSHDIGGVGVDTSGITFTLSNIRVLPVPAPPLTPTEDTDMPTMLLHSNGTTHYVWIDPDTQEIRHGAWTSADGKPEYDDAGGLKARGIHAFFEDPVTHHLVLIAQSTEPAQDGEWFDTVLSLTNDLTADNAVAGGGWVKR